MQLSQNFTCFILLFLWISKVLLTYQHQYKKSWEVDKSEPEQFPRGVTVPFTVESPAEIGHI